MTFRSSTPWFALVGLASVVTFACSSSDSDPAERAGSGGSENMGGASGVGGEPASGGTEANPCDNRPKHARPSGVELHLCSKLDGKRCLPEAALSRRAVSYSGYRVDEDPRTETYPSEEEILEDLKLLIDGGFGMIRLFDSGVHGERVIKVINDNDLDLLIHLGVWIDGPKATKDEANQIQIENGIKLANDNKDRVVWVSVGNEVLDDWSSVRTPPEDLVEYIHQVRDAIDQPVTTDDMYLPFKMDAQYTDVKQVVQSVDFLSIHIYAFIDAQWSWAWKYPTTPEGPERAAAMMDAGMKYTKDAIASVQFALKQNSLDLPVLIGEAGWKSRPTKPDPAAGEKYRAHPVNQRMFYDALNDWVYGASFDETAPLAAFYFEAFDEPWKGQDDGWGLFDVERKPKYVVQCDYPDLEPSDPTPYTDADAISFVEAMP